MKQLFKLSLLMTLLLCSRAHAGRKIIAGEVPGSDHPAYYNTVALIKSADHKVFCTGSIASENLIITAKHCLADKKLGDFKIFIGQSTLDLDNGVILEVKRFQVRYPTDWEMSFPSGDIAWVEIDDELPSFARPLRVLSDHRQLSLGGVYVLAGHGNKNASGQIEAGEKFFSYTSLHSYELNARFRDVMVFKGKPGQGACHGDSGGPAYVELPNEKGELEWFLIGVTNGFDLVLTPGSMSRTGDPDFPYHVDCSQNENLYTFIGGHGDWIEKSSGIELYKSEAFKERNWDPQAQVRSLREWCEQASLASPDWNTLKMLLDQKVDTLAPKEARDFYLSCDKIVSYLSELESIRFDGEKMLDAHYGLGNLSLLPKLKSIFISQIKNQLIDLSSLRNIKLDELVIYQTKLTNLKFLDSSVQIKKLDLAKTELESLEGLSAANEVEVINLNSNPLKNVDVLSSLTRLQGLSLATTELEDYEFLRELTGLTQLDLGNSGIRDFQILKGLVNLRELTLSNANFRVIDFSLMTELDRLSLSKVSFQKLKFGKLAKLRRLDFSNSNLHDSDLTEVAFMSSLEEIMLTFNEISDLSIFSGLINLREVNLSSNPVSNLAALKDLEKLEVLRVFRTPIASGAVKKDPENCPLDGAQVLTRFCSR